MHNTGEDASPKSYMIVPGRKSASWTKARKIYSYLGCISFGKILNQWKDLWKPKKWGIYYRTIMASSSRQSHIADGQNRGGQEAESVSRGGAFSLEMLICNFNVSFTKLVLFR